MIRLCVDNFDAQRLHQTLLVQVRVQALHLVVPQLAALESLPPVVLAVVDVAVAGDSVERAVFLAGRAPRERLQNRLAVRVRADAPARHAAAPDVVPRGQPRPDGLALSVQDKHVELMVVAVPRLVHHLRLRPRGLDHVRGLPHLAPLAHVGLFRVADRRHHPSHRLAPAGHENSVPRMAAGREKGLVLGADQRQMVRALRVVRAVFAAHRPQLTDSILQLVPDQGLRALLRAEILFADVPPGLVAHGSRLALVAAALAHQPAEPVLRVALDPASQRHAAHAVLRRQSVDPLLQIALPVPLQDVEGDHSLLTLQQDLQTRVALAHLVARQVELVSASLHVPHHRGPQILDLRLRRQRR